jgi:hypothetical protein
MPYLKRTKPHLISHSGKLEKGDYSFGEVWLYALRFKLSASTRHKQVLCPLGALP